MAIQIALHTDGGVNITFDRGKFAGTATYRIWDDAGAALTIQDVLSSSTVQAKVYSTYDRGSAADGCLTELGAYLTARCRQVSVDYKQADAGGQVWEAVVVLDSAVGQQSGTEIDAKNENQSGFTALEASLEAQSVDIWRTDGATAITFPSGSAIDNPTEVDIGGEKVDSGGEPITGFVNVARITVRNVVLGRPSVPLTFLNKRNSDSVALGPYTFAARTLLFTGCSISRVGAGTYEQTWEFAWDNGYHLRQVAGKLPNGEVKASAKADTCTGTPTEPSGAGATYARCVYWKQPFPKTAAFGAACVNLGVYLV
jgi:hypothetical protein